MNHTHRIQILQANLQPQQVFLLSRPADVEYFTGLATLNPEERESFFVLTKSSATLLYPSFSPVTRYKGVKYHAGHWPNDLSSVIETLIETEDAKEIYIDKSSLFVSEFEVIKNLDLKISELDNATIWQQRVVKDEEELELLKMAGEVTAKVMKKILNQLTEGQTEREISQKIEIEIRKIGAERASFPPVIAFGVHSALPHHQPTDTKLKKNTVVLIDMGAKYRGYCGDMTRTVWFGPQPNKKFLEIEAVVKDAYSAAFDTVKADVSGAAVDLAARKIIRKAGYGNNFIHTTGHGVGLEIHEQPSLYHKKDLKLPESAVVTVEPGIYLEGEFGYRYENMVQVTNTGGRILT
ncbi:MAG: Xaa-Pro dipeptidase [Patescibacteria group bacterium]|jgi:Xaa-Pro dipeptidase|nr:Xaa-Pro dipeptidase [Patescibacteria group bacterium]